MSFTNAYYKRATATPRGCFVCYKPTTTVLATINTVDFLYTCPVHLTDPNFASSLGESSDGLAGSSRKLGLNAEEIAKVKEEWEERQRAKLEKAKQKEEDSKKDQKKEKEGEEEEKKTERTTESNTPVPSAAATKPTTSSHQRFTLHRDFFAMRLAEHRKRRQIAQVRDLAPRLPGAPSGGFPSPSPA